MALQGADRLHRLQHLADTLPQVFTAHAAQLARVHPPRAAPTPVDEPTAPAAVPEPSAAPLTPPQSSTAAARLARPRRTRRWPHCQPGGTYHQPGGTLDAIAPPVGRSRRTVPRYLQSPTAPERQPRHSRDRSLLDPYKAPLGAGWTHGWRTGWHLFRAIRRRGFRGRYGVVALSVRRRRQAPGLAPGHRRRAQPWPPGMEAPRRPLTPRRATGLVLRPRRRATAQHHQRLAQLPTPVPDLAEAGALAQDVAALARQRQPTPRDPGLVRAAQSALPPSRRFARGRRADLAAAQAAVTRPWTQGPIAGHIKRLKRLKRQMYGRARLALLARRVLRVA
jgi:transposase